MIPKITKTQQGAIDSQHGCTIVLGKSSPCILMTMEVYRDTMGIESDQALQASLQDLNVAHLQVAASNTKTVDEVFAELYAQYEV